MSHSYIQDLDGYEFYGIDEDIMYEAIKNNQVSFLGIQVKMRKEAD